MQAYREAAKVVTGLVDGSVCGTSGLKYYLLTHLSDTP